MKSDLRYLSGFGNEFSSEAMPGTLPEGQNTPQRVQHGLYAEQLSGTAFTVPRAENLRTWLYKIRPSVVQGTYIPLPDTRWLSPPFKGGQKSPNPMRWNPYQMPTTPTDFVDGVVTYAANGCVESGQGIAAHIYCANKPMGQRFFSNSDGELLIVPQEGQLEIRTELGVLQIEPQQIAVIPRGVKFQVNLLGATARGYMAENFGAPLRLPNLGPIGANGLANARDFQAPVASFEDSEGDFCLVTKFQGKFWQADIGHCPLDVVGWHGNYVPYRYDLRNFCTVNSVSFDHCDPSIFTVLTSPTATAGVANMDFVIFPPRWMVAQKTFRPPYYHRNVMSEFMGLIEGVYDAKPEGFVPGGASLHNCMSGHGPDAEAFEVASKAQLKPERYENTMAFMFESCRPFEVAPAVLRPDLLQATYPQCWQTLKKHFTS